MPETWPPEPDRTKKWKNKFGYEWRYANGGWCDNTDRVGLSWEEVRAMTSFPLTEVPAPPLPMVLMAATSPAPPRVYFKDPDTRRWQSLHLGTGELSTYSTLRDSYFETEFRRGYLKEAKLDAQSD